MEIPGPEKVLTRRSRKRCCSQGLVGYVNRLTFCPQSSEEAKLKEKHGVFLTLAGWHHTQPLGLAQLVCPYMSPDNLLLRELVLLRNEFSNCLSISNGQL